LQQTLSKKRVSNSLTILLPFYINAPKNGMDGPINKKVISLSSPGTFQMLTKMIMRGMNSFLNKEQSLLIKVS
jgi:hypothetical protein